MRDGLISGFGAYVMWGLLPLYLRLMQGIPAGDVLAHRVAWSLLALTLVITLVGGWRRLPAVLANRRLLLLLLGSAVAIGVNWLVYTWAILNGQALDTSLGYFINPLLNVLFGVALLGERLNRLQWAAVGLAALGVAVQTISLGYLPWVSLVLAVSFAVYGLIRKQAAVDGLSGLMVETILLAPLALLWLGFGAAPLDSLSGQQWAILIGMGGVTILPLLLFGRAARILPLTTLGLIQYLSPTLVMIEAVTLFGETLSPARLAAFSCIWAGLALYTWSLRPVAQAAPTR
jgi:chloramphenicol-sensitive protein RarD